MEKKVQYTCPNCRQGASSKTDHVADYDANGQKALWSCNPAEKEDAV